MIIPSCKTIEMLAEKFDIIPVCKQIYADVVPPIAILRRLLNKSRRCFLLESIEGNEKLARYSFLGLDPLMRITCKNSVISVTGETQKTVTSDRPLDVLRDIMAEFRAPSIPQLPPFCGGLVGYFSYGMIGYAEPVLRLVKDDGYDFELMLFDKVIVYDHYKQIISVIANMRTDRVMENYGKAISEIDSIINIICDNEPLPYFSADGNPIFECNVTKEEFCANVEKTREHIQRGDIFQAVISRRFESDYSGSLLNAYRVLRTTNPSPYMVYMHFDDLEIAGASPETLVRLYNGRLSTFPVAGSCPRGETELEDKALEADLLSDEKELSEHNMLVDLARNDLGKISKISSVKVMDYMMIHRYSRIMHIASRVEGDIRDGCDAFDAIEAILPAGTLSGAPKIRACEIINELEKCPRGIYGGALGYIGFSGNLDTCIAIRMAVKQGGRVCVQAGGGIVADSVPEREYEESANKAKALVSAIQSASRVGEQ